MDVLDLWWAADVTSRVCQVIAFLKTDPNYTKENAAEELEELLEKCIIPHYEGAAHRHCPIIQEES